MGASAMGASAAGASAAGPSAVPASAATYHFSTASLQSSPATRLVSGKTNFSASSMMQGGTDSEHFLRHTLAGALPPHRMSKTLLWQQAFPESCPRTLVHV